MAALDAAARQLAWADFMREESTARQPMGLLKANLKAALDAADDWAEANAASFNTAIPQPARGALSARQKAKLLALVLERRYGTLA